MSVLEKLTEDVLVASILMGLTALVGIVGNVLMLRALYLYKNLRNEFFILFGSIAISDIVSLIIVVPKHIIDLTSSPEPITDSWCQSSKYLEIGTGFVASYHLVLLAIFRAVLLTNRGHNPPTSLQTVLFGTGMWLVAMLCAVPFVYTVENHEGRCMHMLDLDLEKDLWLQHSFISFVPVVFIAGIYALTYTIGMRYFEDSYSSKEKQTARLVTVLVGALFVCHFPYRVIDIYLYYREKEAAHHPHPDGETLESLYVARNYLLCVLMAEKAARPIIYSKLGSQELADAFDEVINCTACHQYYMRGRRNAQLKLIRGHTSPLPSTASQGPLIGDSGEMKDEVEIVSLAESGIEQS